MKLASLQLQKFKSFQSETRTFAPITLLTGANSSGKTSILQALCAIAQQYQLWQYAGTGLFRTRGLT
jgi:predicted ATP-dependent endonuclease of OLD family